MTSEDGFQIHSMHLAKKNWKYGEDFFFLEDGHQRWWINIWERINQETGAMTQQIRALPEKPQEYIIILFYFRKFNKITFPFLFLTPNPAICTSQLFFKFMSSSYINCYFPHTCICTVLLVCFQGWSLGSEHPVEVFFSGDDHLSWPQLSSVVCGSLCTFEHLWVEYLCCPWSVYIWTFTLKTLYSPRLY